MGSAGYTLARYYGEKVLTDTGDPAGAIPGLGMPRKVQIVDYGFTQYGFGRVPATSPDPGLWLKLSFENVVNPPESVIIYVAEYHEGREPYVVCKQERAVYFDEDDGDALIYPGLGTPSGNRRAPGHHWVYVYNEQGQKIAEAEYQVLP